MRVVEVLDNGNYLTLKKVRDEQEGLDYLASLVKFYLDEERGLAAERISITRIRLVKEGRKFEVRLVD